MCVRAHMYSYTHVRVYALMRAFVLVYVYVRTYTCVLSAYFEFTRVCLNLRALNWVSECVRL